MTKKQRMGELYWFNLRCISVIHKEHAIDTFINTYNIFIGDSFKRYLSCCRYFKEMNCDRYKHQGWFSWSCGVYMFRPVLHWALCKRNLIYNVFEVKWYSWCKNYSTVNILNNYSHKLSHLKVIYIQKCILSCYPSKFLSGS